MENNSESIWVLTPFRLCRKGDFFTLTHGAVALFSRWVLMLYTNDMSGTASPKKIWEIVGIVAACAIVAALMLRNASRPAEQILPPAPQPAPVPGQTTYVPTPIAPNGFAAQLPAGLIAEKGVVAEQSLKTVDSADTSLISGTYISSESLERNIDLFGAYFESHGWTVKHKASADAKSTTFFYAVKGAQVLNITFAYVSPADPLNKTVRVSIAYKPK